MDLGLLGFFKKLITSQINWLTVWLKLQLQAGAESFAESFPLSNPSGDRPGSCARGGAERLTAQRAVSPILTPPLQAHQQLPALSAP